MTCQTLNRLQRRTLGQVFRRPLGSIAYFVFTQAFNQRGGTWLFHGRRLAECVQESALS
jgi:hypothetical protein